MSKTQSKNTNSRYPDVPILRSARLYIRRGQYRRAMYLLIKAIEASEPGETLLLDRLLYYLGVTFARMGQRKAAYRAWTLGNKIRRKGLSSKMLQRNTSPYGLMKGKSSEEDDFNAFRELQVRKYLQTKEEGCFSHQAEADFVMDTLKHQWEEMRLCREYATLDTQAKWAYFSCYPALFALPDFHTRRSNVIKVDFQKKKSVHTHYHRAHGS